MTKQLRAKRKRVLTPTQALRWIANHDGGEPTIELVEAAIRGLAREEARRKRARGVR